MSPGASTPSPTIALRPTTPGFIERTYSLHTDENLGRIDAATTQHSKVSNNDKISLEKSDQPNDNDTHVGIASQSGGTINDSEGEIRGNDAGPLRLPNGNLSSVWLSPGLTVDTSFSPWANN